MTRMTTVSTAAGLLGLVTAMLVALSGNASPAILAVGLALMALGLLGAVIGAATSLTRVWQSSR